MNHQLLRNAICSKQALVSAIALFLSLPVMAGNIGYPDDSYTTGDTLSASDLNAKFNGIKSSVNDNDSRISVLEGSAQPPANMNSLLNGTYAFTGEHSCLEATTISPGFVPSGTFISTYNGFSGTATFDGAGNVTRTSIGTYLVPLQPSTTVPQAGTNSKSCTETYTVNADLSVTLAGNCDFVFTGGTLAGVTGTITGRASHGYVNAQGTALITTFANGNIDHMNMSNGYSTDRACIRNAHWIRQ